MQQVLFSWRGLFLVWCALIPLASFSLTVWLDADLLLDGFRRRLSVVGAVGVGLVYVFLCISARRDGEKSLGFSFYAALTVQRLCSKSHCQC